MISIERMFPLLNAEWNNEAAAALRRLWQRSDLGFLRLGERAELWAQSEKRADQIKKMSVKKVVVVGMGGSSLGPKAFWEGFGRWQGRLDEMLFFDNLDSTQFFSTLEKFKSLQDFHFLLISKSGNTLETLAMADFLQIFLAEHKMKLSDQCTVISEVKSNPLSNWARENSIALLEIPIDVGGRFSVLSPVGLLPAALMGCSLSEIKMGWEWAKSAKNLTEDLVASVYVSLFQRKDEVLYFWPYSQGCEVFGQWFQQLWSESLGKPWHFDHNEKLRVSVPVASLGPRDQHSILQQVMEGSQPKWVWIIKNLQPLRAGPVLKESLFEKSEWRVGKTMHELVSVQAEATGLALVQNGIPTMTLTLNDLMPKTMGALFFLMEVVVGAAGEMMGINAFDQPGVELSKKLTKEFLTKDLNCLKN